MARLLVFATIGAIARICHHWRDRSYSPHMARLLVFATIGAIARIRHVWRDCLL
jgi:hypothetical protein